VVPTFKYGDLNFDAEKYADYDRQNGPGIWLEIPDDVLGSYVFFPFTAKLPDLSKYSRVRIYQEVIPEPLLMGELTGKDFKTRRFETADQLASFLINRDPGIAEASRVLGEPPAEINQPKFPRVHTLHRKDRKIEFRWLPGSSPTLFSQVHLKVLPGFLIELADRRPGIYIFYPSTETMPDLNGLGRVRIYKPGDLQGEMVLTDFPNPVIEVNLSDDDAVWTRSTVEEWIAARLQKTSAATPPPELRGAMRGLTECAKAMRQLPPPQRKPEDPNSKK